jgi:hypothetical protein
MQTNHGAWILALIDIREALLGGCSAVLELEQDGQKSYAIPPPRFWFPPDRLRWVNALNPSMQRKDYPDRPWPWELRAYLSPSESWEFCDLEGRPLAREKVNSTLHVFLRRAEAVKWGLLPALESPQATGPPVRQASDAALRKAISETPEEWFLEPGRSEEEIRERIEGLAGGAVSRDRLRSVLKAGVPGLKNRGRGRPKKK